MAKEFNDDEFIAASESLLEDADSIGDVASIGDDPNNQWLQAEIRKRATGLHEGGVDLQLDGYYEIQIEEDDRRALGHFYPPSGDRKPINAGDVITDLTGLGVNTGISIDAIEQAVYRCNTVREPVEEVVIAKAIDPIGERPEHYEINDTLLDPGDVPPEKDGRTDHRKRTPFILVEKGTLLARHVPRTEGRMGRTIKGEESPYRRVTFQSLTPGNNTEVSHEGILAACDGRLVTGGGTVAVSPVLRIDGDVGYKTGHIDFPGDVDITGNVATGFTVRAAGDIRCRLTLDATLVECGGSLTVSRGIIGRGSGTVRVGGSVSTRFIENCHVESQGDIIVETAILNSSVHTKGEVRVGPRGVIVGGLVEAQKGVVAAQIGTASGPHTEIHCGTDFAVEQRLVMVRDRNIELAMNLKKIEGQIGSKHTTPERKERLLELRDQTREFIHKLNEAASTLVFRLDKDEDAKVIVVGKVFSGTYVEICHLPFVVDRSLVRMSFRLDKKNGRILADPLTENPYS